ncbi:CynX/NimT family MFS transporter [Streptomyces sp. H34-S4]|uniref:CynX/NimT family MFS transporter n=1 Tax=Streptomyces sp. H34-S4 TaxID=2996463 RepID=UPI00226E05B7|nr:MFS transporter [Streptomyces sp. H34-S4]MCY0933791.1 MFS transporter [Streptomyces sp. H34-S4]
MSDEEIQTLNRPRAAHTASAQPLPAAAPQPAWLGPVLLVGIVLAALNLRPAITSLGALFEETRTGLGMSGTVAGLITSVPALCFAVFGVTAPRLSRRFGPAAVVCAGMAAVAAGLLIRPFATNAAGFLAASALSLAGIALTNVLLPVIVKRWFPDRVATMTGLYSMALAAGTSLAAATTVPLTEALGGSWRTGLLIWAFLAVAAVLPWLPIAAAARKEKAAAGVPAARPDAGPSVVRSRTAWALACYFGLQATGAYITMGWLPQIFRDAGVSASTAGVLLAVTMVMGVPLAFVIPGLAGRMRNQGPIAVVLGLFGLVGYLGLYFAPVAGAWAWAVLLGVSNCAFPLVITLIGLRAKSPAGVVKLSAFAQSTGYLISIPGPLLIGALYQHTGGWDLPLALMAGLLVPQIALGVLAGRDRTIEDECGMRD